MKNNGIAFVLKRAHLLKIKKFERLFYSISFHLVKKRELQTDHRLFLEPKDTDAECYNECPELLGGPPAGWKL